MAVPVDSDPNSSESNPSDPSSNHSSSTRRRSNRRRGARPGSSGKPGSGKPGSGKRSSDDAQLKAGLAAAKAKDYDQAIAHLRQVKPGPCYDRAQMALVIALGKTGDRESAIAHCQPLLNSTARDIQKWAKSSLKKLQAEVSATAPSEPSPGLLSSAQPKLNQPQPGSPKAVSTADVDAVLLAGPESSLSTDSPSESKPVFPPCPRLPFKQAPAPQRWTALRPLATSRWIWAGFALLLLWPLHWLNQASIWPNLIAPYSIWIVGFLGVLGYGIIWINHRKIGRSLAPLSLRLQETLTIFAIAWFVPWSLPTAVDLFNQLFALIPFWQPQLRLSTQTLHYSLMVLGLPLLMTLPWATSGLLRLYGPWKSMTGKDLTELSPQSKPLLRQLFRVRHGVQLPQLLCLDSPIPILTSYGHRPRNARIIVSQGLLDRLSGEQIAALVAGELGQIQSQSFVVLSWLNLLPQLPLGLYVALSRLGNHCQSKLKTPMDVGFRFLYRSGLLLSGLLGAIAYGCFKLWRWPLLWLARARTAYADRAAVDLLGDPNAYSRGLMAYAEALADAIATVEQTPPLVEALELVLPLGLPDALTASFAPEALSREQRFAWGSASPYRRWLSLNNSHPPLGDRLAHLGLYAKRSRVTPEVELAPQPTTVLNFFTACRPLANRRWKQARQLLNESFAAWGPLLYQGFPFYGAVLGLLFGFGLWAVGATASLFGLWWLDGLYGDRQVLWGCIPIGIGVGLIIRTNAFFPQRANREKSPAVAATALLPEPNKLPLAAEPVEFSGKLVGRPGLANWLGQDLLLLSEQGPLRLHWCSPLGPVGNLWPKFLRPSFLLNREVIVSGWLRRGATLWLDVEQIRTASGGKSSQRGHPMWAAVMAAIALGWGIMILLPGR